MALASHRKKFQRVHLDDVYDMLGKHRGNVCLHQPLDSAHESGCSAMQGNSYQLGGSFDLENHQYHKCDCRSCISLYRDDSACNQSLA